MPPAERDAVLDNDGTLWCERPAYVQALFALDRLREAAAERPELAEQPVVKALVAGDLAAATTPSASTPTPAQRSPTPMPNRSWPPRNAWRGRS